MKDEQWKVSKPINRIRGHVDGYGITYLEGTVVTAHGIVDVSAHPNAIHLSFAMNGVCYDRKITPLAKLPSDTYCVTLARRFSEEIAARPQQIKGVRP